MSAGSTTIGGLGVVLGLNYGGFTAGIAASVKDVSSLVGSIGSLSKAALGMVGISSIAGSVSKAFSGFQKVEENRVTFEALTGSAFQAKKLMSELSEVAYKSTFASEFSGAAKELLKFGFATDQVAPTLEMLGNIASGTGGNIGELAQLVGASGYRAAISKRQLAGLAEAGVPVLQELSKDLNLTKDSVLQLADQGGIKFEDLMRVLQRVTGEGGNFHDMMKKRGETTLGAWTRIEEGVGGAIGKFGSVFGDSLTKALGFQGGLSGIADWIDEMRKGVGGLSSGIDLVVLGLQTFAEIGKTVWEGVSIAFQIGWAVIKGVFDSCGGAISTFRELFVEGCLAAQFVFQNFGEVMAYEWTLMKLGLYAFGQDAVHLFTVNVPEILSWFSRNWRNVFTDMWNFTVTIFTNIGKNIWEFFKNIPGLLAGTTTFAEIWTPLTDGFKSSITEALTVTKREMTDYEKELLSTAGGMQQKLAQKWTDFYNERKAKFDPQIAKKGTFLSDFIQDVAFGKKGGFAGTGTIAATQKDTSVKRTALFDYGSKEAYSTILGSRDFDISPAKQTAKATQDTARNTAEANKALTDLKKSVDEITKVSPGSL